MINLSLVSFNQAFLGLKGYRQVLDPLFKQQLLHGFRGVSGPVHGVHIMNQKLQDQVHAFFVGYYQVNILLFGMDSQALPVVKWLLSDVNYACRGHVLSETLKP